MTAPQAPDWSSYSHRQIYDMVTQGKYDLAGQDALDYWTNARVTIMVIEKDLQKGLREIGSGWEGQAADAAARGISPLGQWALDAVDRGQATTDALHNQSDYAYHTLRNMPPPDDADTPATPPADPGVFAGEAWRQANARRIEDEARARDLMATYQANTDSNTPALVGWTPPPQVVFGGGDGAPGSGTGVGAAGGTGGGAAGPAPGSIAAALDGSPGSAGAGAAGTAAGAGGPTGASGATAAGPGGATSSSAGGGGAGGSGTGSAGVFGPGAGGIGSAGVGRAGGPGSPGGGGPGAGSPGAAGAGAGGAGAGGAGAGGTGVGGTGTGVGRPGASRPGAGAAGPTGIGGTRPGGTGPGGTGLPGARPGLGANGSTTGTTPPGARPVTPGSGPGAAVPRLFAPPNPGSTPGSPGAPAPTNWRDVVRANGGFAGGPPESGGGRPPLTEQAPRGAAAAADPARTTAAPRTGVPVTGHPGMMPMGGAGAGATSETRRRAPYLLDDVGIFDVERDLPHHVPPVLLPPDHPDYR